MNNLILELAQKEGFSAAIIDTSQIEFDPVFVKYCAENLCGNYNANYSCPPACGTPEEMKGRLLQYPQALVVQSRWPITDYTDHEAIRAAKASHNAAMFRIDQRMKELGFNGIIGGASNCTLCKPCLMQSGEPCRFPEQRFSCLSAYCVHVKKLADLCEMEYFCQDGLALFGVYAFKK